MLTQEEFDKVNVLIAKKSTPEQIKESMDAARAVYEKHMGKFPPVPDAVFMELYEAFSEVSKKDLSTKLGKGINLRV